MWEILGILFMIWLTMKLIVAVIWGIEVLGDSLKSVLVHFRQLR